MFIHIMTALECFLLFIVTFASFRLKIITSLYFDHVFQQCSALQFLRNSLKRFNNSEILELICSLKKQLFISRFHPQQNCNTITTIQVIITPKLICFIMRRCKAHSTVRPLCYFECKPCGLRIWLSNPSLLVGLDDKLQEVKVKMFIEVVYQNLP